MHVLALPNSSLIRRCAIGAATVAPAIAAVSLLQPLFGGSVPTILLLPFVVVAAWFGGFSGGLLSTGLQSLAAAYFLIPPIHSFDVGGIQGWTILAIFAGQGVLISWLCESRRGLQISCAQTAGELRRARIDASARLNFFNHVNSDLKALTSAIVRDLPVPLEALQSFSHSLVNVSRESIDPRVRDCAGAIQSNASRIRELIDSLISFSSINEDQKRFTPIDSRTLIEHAAVQWANEIQATGASVTYDRQLPTVRGDARQLSRVFAELIENAIKFRGDDPPRVHVSCKPDEGSFVFSVSDNGIGIVPARWEEVFVLFRRLNTSERPGAGVGLAVCRRIVENHGGRIWLSSAFGVGTTVRFEIPCDPKPTSGDHLQR